MKPNRLKICRDEDCLKTFVPFKTTDAYCSFTCAANNKKPGKPRKPINKKSDKQKERDKVYLQLRKVYLKKPENKYCRVFPKKLANEVHHKKGRTGKLLLYVPFWLAVSTEGHTWIHANPTKAYKKGLLIKSTNI